MNQINAGAFVSDEISALQKEQENCFRETVRAKLLAITDTTAKLATLQKQLQTQREELRALSYTPIDPVTILGFNDHPVANAVESPRHR